MLLLLRGRRRTRIRARTRKRAGDAVGVPGQPVDQNLLLALFRPFHIDFVDSQRVGLDDGSPGLVGRESDAVGKPKPLGDDAREATRGVVREQPPRGLALRQRQNVGLHGVPEALGIARGRDRDRVREVDEARPVRDVEVVGVEDRGVTTGFLLLCCLLGSGRNRDRGRQGDHPRLLPLLLIRRERARLEHDEAGAAGHADEEVPCGVEVEAERPPGAEVRQRPRVEGVFFSFVFSASFFHFRRPPHVAVPVAHHEVVVPAAASPARAHRDGLGAEHAALEQPRDRRRV